MHDIDQTQTYNEAFPDAFGEMGGDYAGESGGEIYDDSQHESPFTPDQEIDLASELLTIGNDAELDQFLGSLIKKAGHAIGKFARTPVGRSLIGILRSAAKKALPIAGSALGGLVGGPAGAALGGKLASMAGDKFGLEIEGLSSEDATFEVAKQFVRLGGAAAQRAAMAPMNVHPHSAAQAAFAAAARRYAPGLVGGALGGGSGLTGTSGRMGRWIRRGSKIIVMGV